MKDLIEKFYASFSALDGEGMAACYHDEIRFHDPAFGELRGARAGNMWRMLCESQKGKDLRVEYSDIESDGQTGKAHWEAFYTFGQTGRKVHNRIEASFTFQDGKIIRHIDDFNLYRWSRQAMGPTGFLIGWTPFFRKKLQGQTNKMLAKYEQRKA